MTNFPDSEKAFEPVFVSGSGMDPWAVAARFHLTGHLVFQMDCLVFQKGYPVFRKGYPVFQKGHPVFRMDFLILPLESSMSSGPDRP